MILRPVRVKAGGTFLSHFFTLTDPHAAAEEQAWAARHAMNYADWARYRLEDFGAAGSEAGEAQTALTDVIETLRPYAAKGDPFALTERAEPDTQGAFTTYADTLWELYAGEIKPNSGGELSLLQSLDESRLTDISGIRENPYLSGLDWQKTGLNWAEREALFDAWAKMTGVSDSVGTLAEFYDMEYNNPER